MSVSTETSAPAPQPAAPAASAPASTPISQLAPMLERMKAAGLGRPAPTYGERVAHLRALETLLVEHKNEICDAISEDFGNRSKHETLLAEVFVSLEGVRYILAHLREWMEPERRNVGWAFLPAGAKLVYQPLGVVGIIAPWNYPFNLAIIPLAGALGAGNRAMIKPSELTPRIGALMKKLLATKFSEDQVAVVTGGADLGEAFSHLPFDHLQFTGSTRVGKAVMRAAAENLVPVTLELGGKSPVIIGPDFPIDQAAAKIMFGKLFDAGQTCIAPDYVLLPRDKRDQFIEAAQKTVAELYPTLARNKDYTSIVSDRHYQRLESYLSDADTRGAKLLKINPGGETLDPANRKLAPTLVIDPTEDMTVMQDEIFGPILPIVTYGELGEAIKYVNAHPRPLALYAFSHDQRTVDRVIEETISGGVAINETMMQFAQDDLPFGGVGPSGMGHYHGKEGFETFSKKKPIFTQARLNTTKILRPPYGALLETFFRFVLGK